MEVPRRENPVDGKALSALAIIVAILSTVFVVSFVSLSTQAQVALLKNDIKALEGELSIYKKSVEQAVKQMEELQHRVSESAAVEHHETEQLQPTIEVTLETSYVKGKFSFTGIGGNIEGMKNPTLHIKLGNIVKIVVVNGDGVEHDLIIDGLNVHSEHISRMAESTSVIFRAEKEGEIHYYCSVPGHKELGMEGMIVVEE